MHKLAWVVCNLGGCTRPPSAPKIIAANMIPRQKGYTMDARLVILSIAVTAAVIGRLLYELNPSLWKNAAARVEDDTSPNGAIDDYLEWVEEREEMD
ncbi:MAG: hypothetical protein ACK2UQ_12305 [Anaerolineae bacterium]